MTTTVSKEEILKMAAEEVEQILQIIGDLGHIGYKISICKLKGYSYQQCARKFGVTRKIARTCWKNCVLYGHDLTLKKIFRIDLI